MRILGQSRRTLTAVAGATALVLLATGQVWAQDSGAPPKPPVREILPLISNDAQDSNDTQNSPDVTPDQRPLTGIQELTVGTPQLRHSYIVPGFLYTNLLDSNVPNSYLPGRWGSTNYLVGNVSLLDATRHSELLVNYSGGGSISSSSSYPSSFYQQAAVQEGLHWERFQIALLDEFSYLPQSSFGFGGADLGTAGVGGVLGGQGAGLIGSYVPNQSIYTSLGSRYTNALAGQLAYNLTARSQITLAASYGILRFAQAGNVDSNVYTVNGGYNYEISRRDTIGLQYRFSAYRFSNLAPAFNDETAQLFYGRRVTGRLALQLYGGPEITSFQRTLAPAPNRISGSGGVNLTYKLSRTQLGFSYIHGLSSGSGVLTGALSDQVQAQLEHGFTPSWTGKFGVGYARNGELRQLAPALPGVPVTYNTTYFRTSASRRIGHNANFAAGYTARWQSTKAATCSTTSCTSSYLQHEIQLGFEWHTRPYVLR